HHPADEFVHASVQILDDGGPLIARHLAGGGMIVIEVAPEHVLHAVGGVEHAGAEALLGLLKGIEKHALAILMIGIALRQESLIVENFFVQRPSVFRQSQSGVRSKEFCQVNGVRYWMRDGQIGPARIDVYGSNVDLDLGRNFLQVKAADAMRAEAHSGLEFDRNPLRVITDFQSEACGIDREASLVFAGISMNLKIYPQFVAGTAAQGILRARYVGTAS